MSRMRFMDLGEPTKSPPMKNSPPLPCQIAKFPPTMITFGCTRGKSGNLYDFTDGCRCRAWERRI